MKPTTACPAGGCDRPAASRGLCKACLSRLYRYGDPAHRPRLGRPPQHVRCSTPHCDRPHYARGLCRLHYDRRRQRGDYIDDPRPPATSPVWRRAKGLATTTETTT